MLCRRLLVDVGGSGLHWRFQRLLAGILAVVGCIGGFSGCWQAYWRGQCFIGGISGVGSIIIVSVSAVVGDPRRLWAALAGSVAVGGRIGGVNVYRRHCMSRRYYHCLGVIFELFQFFN